MSPSPPPKDDGGHNYRPVTGGIEWTTATGHSYTRESDRKPRHRHRHRRAGHRHTGATIVVALRGHAALVS